MKDTDSNQDTISQSKAEELAGAFLKERHYEHEKIVFQSCEQVQAGEHLIYRFGGILVEKTRALMDLLARDKRAVTYKFIIEINSKNGRVLNYYLT